MEIRDALADDAAAIAAIYNHYVLHTVVSMEEEAVSAAAMAQRIADVQSAALPWLVLCDQGAVAGYAYASKWRARPGYRHSVESSVYLAGAYHGRGLGVKLQEVVRTNGKSGDRCFASDALVRSMPVVVVVPFVQHRCALIGGLVDEAVRPLAQR